MEKLTFKGHSFRVYRSGTSNSPQLVIFHGICEHALRYLSFIKELNKLGFDCTLIDHPGHGQHIDESINSDKAFHVFNSLENLQELSELSDNSAKNLFQKKFIRTSAQLRLQTICDFQQSFYRFLFKEKIFSGERPTFILGQSMGGLIAAHLGKSLLHLKGIILLSPAFKALPQHITGNSFNERFKRRLESGIIKKSDESFTKNTLFKIAVLRPLAALNPAADCTWAKDYISDISRINTIFAMDPYIGRKIKLRFLQTIQQQMFETREAKDVFPLPVFIEYGELDKIVSSEGSDRFIMNRLTGNVHFRKKLNGFEPHEIHNSSLQEELVNDLSGWISSLT